MHLNCNCTDAKAWHSQDIWRICTLEAIFKPEVIPLWDISYITCARALITYWISRFGVPTYISSDRGIQFSSELWSAMAQLLGVKLPYITVYHPQGNSVVEHFHRHIMTSLKARQTCPNWMDELRESCWVYAVELVYGAPLYAYSSRKFIPKSRKKKKSPSTMLTHLSEKIRTLSPVPTSGRSLTTRYVPPELQRQSLRFLP